MHSTRKRKEDWAKEVYNPIQIRIVMPQRGRGERDKEESSGSHDSGFARLRKEQEEEERKRKLMGKTVGDSQCEDFESMEGVDCEVSHTAGGGGHEGLAGKKDIIDEDMIDVESAMEREEEEMRMLDQKFEEKIERLAQMIGLHKGEASGSQAEAERGSKFIMVEKQSSRVANRDAKIMDKAQARKTKENEPGISKKSSSILRNFHFDHIVSVAQSCGIILGKDESSVLEVIKTLEAQEQAQAMLNDASIRRERELQLEKEKQQQLVNIEGYRPLVASDVECENDNRDKSSSDESLEGAPKQPRVAVCKRRQGTRGVGQITRSHESSLLEY
jgi:hypothetical protein